MNNNKKSLHLKTKINTKRQTNENEDNCVSDDPFEVFFKDYGEFIDVLEPQYEQENARNVIIEEENNVKIHKKKKLTDSDFMNILKSNANSFVSKPKCDFGICNRIKILTSEELNIPEMTLYKFPFEMDIKFEKSQIFSQVYKIFVIALKNVYKKYKENNQEFYMKFNGSYLHFGAKLKTIKGLKKLFNINDVKFEENGEFLIVEHQEIGLIIDLIMNYEPTRTSTIPFILSKHPFENGIIYTTYLQKMCTVKQEDDIVSSYVFHGPVWIQECQDLLNHNNKIIW